LNSTDASAVDDALRTVLAGLPEFASPVARISRQPSPYRTSFALEEITVDFADGLSLPIIFKDLGWQSLTPAGQRAKPVALYDAMREIEVYRLLNPRSLGPARCYGTIADPDRQRYWLFLEKAPGAELYQFGSLDVWGEAGRWLAGFHHDEDVRRAALHADIRPHLVRYDFSYFRGWMDRAVEYAGGKDHTLVMRLRHLAARYDEVALFLATLPVTLIHGEFYASNVLVDTDARPARVCAVDWELCGIGPAVIDLAALVVGKWTEAERGTLIAAYQSGLPAESAYVDDLAALTCALDHARLHLAVQWLGWSPEWSPPAAHAQDWLAEALTCGARLGYL
jgi:hypothetical protein